MHSNQAAPSYPMENPGFDLESTFTIIILAYDEEKIIKPVLINTCLCNFEYENISQQNKVKTICMRI